MLKFIAPATPVLRSTPPRGAEWLHEAKFDGWRIQLHKDGSVARLYSKRLSAPTFQTGSGCGLMPGHERSI
jgi:ATP-dependent DNA ligase